MPKSVFWTDDLPVLRGPWLGQELPGTEPAEFCPELFSATRRVSCTAFSPAGDELFFSVLDPQTEIASLGWTGIERGVWCPPRPAPFNSDWNDNDICMSPDGQRVCWRSWRPLPGRSEPETVSVLWASDRTPGGWGEAYPITCGGEIQHAGHPGIARDGSLYFAARLAPGECAVFRARRRREQYGVREPILGGMKSGGDLCIAPDESCLVIACWDLPENNGESDLYVSFQIDGAWTSLRNLGAPINNEWNENCPALTADGKHFLFFRYDRQHRIGRTFWVDARVIEAARLKARRIGDR